MDDENALYIEEIDELKLYASQLTSKLALANDANDKLNQSITELNAEIEWLWKHIAELEADLNNERKISYERGRRIVSLTVELQEATKNV